ncbi:ribosome maturation factor RimP [Glutamicibacter sp. MNS18]|uniref:ribosome maturation factor RimP n=1 Tax=Glutamicibacter sp. MNS18 TaxID=2989817 RepID=UPI0022359856|nr:ribosome maturation factor RimP [Glutamicibacter sp. MNS18]MCW4465266.1 ribosome maturation factor RimP [Glutamicibacter sp. MNS18]
MTGKPADTEQEASRLMAVLQKDVESHGLVLEDITLRPAGKQLILQITVDLPTGTASVNLDQLGEVTETISKVLDSDSVYANAAPYDLEVSSPGLSRPLTETRHWVRALSRLVKFQLTDGTKLRGRITEVGDDEVSIEVHHEPAKKGMKEKIDTARNFALADIRKAVVDIEFNRNDEDLDIIDLEDPEA